MHFYLLSLLNQLQQIGQHKAETWLHYPPTLIWNECEIICLFEPAVLRSGPVWCFIYCHLHAQNSVNPLFVFKHLSCLLCVSLSPYWLLWAVCLAGCQWSWSGRQPAVGDDAWLQRCVTADSRLVLSACMAACPSVCLSEYLSVWTSFLSLPLSACLSVSDLPSILNIFIKSIIHLASFAWFDLLMTENILNQYNIHLLKGFEDLKDLGLRSYPGLCMVDKLWKCQYNFHFSIKVQLCFQAAAPCRPQMSVDPLLQPLQGHQQAPCFGSGPSPHPTPEWCPWLSHSFAGYSLISPLKGLHYFQLPRLVKTNLLSYYSLNWFHHDPSSQPSFHKSSTLRFPQSKLLTRPVQPLNSFHPHHVDSCDFF